MGFCQSKNIFGIGAIKRGIDALTHTVFMEWLKVYMSVGHSSRSTGGVSGRNPKVMATGPNSYSSFRFPGIPCNMEG